MEGQTSGGYATVTDKDSGFTVSSNAESAEEIQDNLATEEAPKDGPPPDPEKEAEEEISKAASKLGEKGGKAAAEKRAKDEKAEKAEAKVEQKDKRGDPRHDPKARMLEATREHAETKRQLAAEKAEREKERVEYKRRLDALESKISQPTDARPAEAAPRQRADADPKPEEKDFEEYSEFIEARARWSARKEYEKIARQHAARAQATQYANALKATVVKFDETISKTREAMPDLDEKISDDIKRLTPTWVLPPDVAPGPKHVLADEIITSEQAPALMIYLSEHPDVFQRIAASPNARTIAREIAKVEAKLETAPTGASPGFVASKAKPPVKPVPGSPQAADPYEVDDDTSLDDHIQKLNALDLKRRRGQATR